MDTCDNCGEIRELYHFDAENEDNPLDGASLCDTCEANARNADETRAEFAQYEDDEVEAEGFHAELRAIIEQAEGTDLEVLVPQAQALLALPEESIAALVSAAQSMVGAASFGRTPPTGLFSSDGTLIG